MRAEIEEAEEDGVGEEDGEEREGETGDVIKRDDGTRGDTEEVRDDETEGEDKGEGVSRGREGNEGSEEGSNEESDDEIKDEAEEENSEDKFEASGNPCVRVCPRKATKNTRERGSRMLSLV